MFDSVIYKPPKILNFESEAKEEQKNAIVITRRVSCLLIVKCCSTSFFVLFRNTHSAKHYLVAAPIIC